MPDIEFLKKISTTSEHHETIDELLALLKIKLNGYILNTPIIPAKYVVCRARKLNGDSIPARLSEVSYPPVHVVERDHRAGRSGESLFYCTNYNVTALYEARAHTDDVIALSYWRARQPLLVGAVGYSRETMERLGSKRSFMGWGKEQFRSTDEEVSCLLANCFTRSFSDKASNPYRASIAISELFLKQPLSLSSPIGGRLPSTFDAILYPSVEGKGDGDNLAIKPDIIDSVFEPLRVEIWHIRERANASLTMNLIGSAMKFTESNEIVWDDVPIKSWSAETAGGYLNFNFTENGFVTTDSAGKVIKRPTIV